MNWKRSFFILLGIVVLIIGYFGYNIGKTTEPGSVMNEVPLGEEIKVTLGREAVETIINRVMQEEKLPITGKLDSKIHFLYRAELLGREVDIFMSGVPKVTNGGNWEIVIEDFSAGNIKIPTDVLFALLEREVGDNPAIYLKRDASILGINFSAIDVGGSLRAREINLEEDILVFSYYLPEENAK